MCEVEVKTGGFQFNPRNKANYCSAFVDFFEMSEEPKSPTDCVGCRLTSGIGVVGIGVYVWSQHTQLYMTKRNQILVKLLGVGEILLILFQRLLLMFYIF